MTRKGTAMKCVWILLVSAIVATTSQLSAGSEVTDQLKTLGLKEYTAPISIDRATMANESPFEYLVDKQGDRLVIHEIEKRGGEFVKGKDALVAAYERRVSPTALSRFQAAKIERGSPSLVFEAGAITYFGTNAGEFGGALYALHKDGKFQTLIPDNVVEILEVKDELLVFTGLAHMGISSGTVWRISDYRKDPRVERLTLLPGTPLVALIGGKYFQDSVLVVTTEAVIELGTFAKLKEMHIDTSDAFWGALHPDSAVQIGSELVVGMRGGIGVFSLPAFYQPSSGPMRFFANQGK